WPGAARPPTPDRGRPLQRPSTTDRGARLRRGTGPGPSRRPTSGASSRSLPPGSPPPARGGRCRPAGRPRRPASALAAGLPERTVLQLAVTHVALPTGPPQHAAHAKLVPAHHHQVPPPDAE